MGGWIDTVVVQIADSFLHSLTVTHDFAKKKYIFLRKLVSASNSLKIFEGQVFLDSVSADSWSESISALFGESFWSAWATKFPLFLIP